MPKRNKNAVQPESPEALDDHSVSQTNSMPVSAPVTPTSATTAARDRSSTRADQKSAKASTAHISATQTGSPPRANGAARWNSAATIRMPELLTANEVAIWLHTTRKAIYAKAERGTLPGVTYIGRRLYFIRSELIHCVEQGRVPDMEK